MNSSTTTLSDQVLASAGRAREASHTLALATRQAKDRALVAMADALLAAHDEILLANAQDVARAEAGGVPANIVDRLRLTEERLASMAQGLRDVAGLPDPVGEVVRGSSLANGLELRQVRVPFGVVAMIYEARPNVTADATGICLKSGNAVLLRGSASARSSNAAIVAVLRSAASAVGLPADVVQLVPGDSHESVQVLMRARGLVDVLIPRGGAALIRSVVEGATVPVIETGVGNCHVYVDRAADLDKAVAIVLNAKTHRTSVCNAAESLLVHADIAEVFVPRIVAALQEAGVTVHGDPAFAGQAGVVEATEEDHAAGVPIPRHLRGSGGRPRCRRAAHPALLQSAQRRHRHRGPVRRTSFRGGGRLSGGAGQRLDPVHRWWRVRFRGRDRHQHAEVARARTDGAARDDLHEVRRHRGRSRQMRSAASAAGSLCAMSTLSLHPLILLAEEVHAEGVNHWLIGGVALAILMALVLGLVMFGAGREHS